MKMLGVTTGMESVQEDEGDQASPEQLEAYKKWFDKWNQLKSNPPSKLNIYGLERPMTCLRACVIIPEIKTVNNRRKLKNNTLLIFQTS